MKEGGTSFIEIKQTAPGIHAQAFGGRKTRENEFTAWNIREHSIHIHNTFSTRSNPLPLFVLRHALFPNILLSDVFDKPYSGTFHAHVNIYV